MTGKSPDILYLNDAIQAAYRVADKLDNPRVTLGGPEVAIQGTHHDKPVEIVFVPESTLLSEAIGGAL